MEQNFSIQNRGLIAFTLAMKLAFTDGFGDRSSKPEDLVVNGYYFDEEKNEIFLTYKSDKSIKLPFEMTADEAINFFWTWLTKIEPKGNKFDGDGSNVKGFYISNSHTNLKPHDDDYRIICMLKPNWIYYGK